MLAQFTRPSLATYSFSVKLATKNSKILLIAVKNLPKNG